MHCRETRLQRRRSTLSVYILAQQLVSSAAKGPCEQFLPNLPWTYGDSIHAVD